MLIAMRRTENIRMLWGMLWALMIVAAAYFLKGRPSSQWVEAGLTGIALTFVVLVPRRSHCLR